MKKKLLFILFVTIVTGLGNTGIAQSNPFEINIYNPASLGNILQNSFLYEFGLNGTYSTLKTNYKTESSTNGNISHIAIAFPISKGWGLSAGLLPYTKTGYNIDVENAIEGWLHKSRKSTFYRFFCFHY